MSGRAMPDGLGASIRRPAREDGLPPLPADLPPPPQRRPLPPNGPPPGAAAPPPPPRPAAEPPPKVDEAVLRQLSASNPLLGPALPLLTLVCQLRGTLRNDDLPRLQFLVSEELKAFESRALLAEASPQDVVAARYVLCSLLDETVLSTPWGAQSPWAAQTMLSVFHRETWGGEKVFVILDRIKAKPARYLHLLELVDVCLALGFRGRYEVLENGLFQLEDLRGEVWRLVQAQRNVVLRPLSPEPLAQAGRSNLRRYVPLWAVFLAAAALAVLLYGGLRYSLEGQVGRAATALRQIDALP